MNHEKAIKALLKNSGAAGQPLSTARGGFKGKWTNQYGSYADFVFTGSSVSGSYTTVVSGTGQPLTGPISGYIADDIIAFSVLWPVKPECITSWVGQFVDVNGTLTLKTLWQIVNNLPDASEPTGLWTSILAGADEFT